MHSSNVLWGKIKPEFLSTHKPSVEPHQHYPSLAQAHSERPLTPLLQSLVKIRSPALQTAGFWAGLGSQWEMRACLATADTAIALYPPWQQSTAGREVVDQWDESQCHPNRADTIYEQEFGLYSDQSRSDWLGLREKRSPLAEERQSFSGRNSNSIQHMYILITTLYTILKETMWTVVKGFISSLSSKMTGFSNTSLSAHFLPIKPIIIAYHRT